MRKTVEIARIIEPVCIPYFEYIDNVNILQLAHSENCKDCGKEWKDMGLICKWSFKFIGCIKFAPTIIRPW